MKFASEEEQFSICVKIWWIDDCLRDANSMKLGKQELTCLGLLAAAVMGNAALLTASETEPLSEAKLEFFEKRIRPLFYNNCYNCHSADNKEAGGLRVDDINALLKGGNSGPGVVPGDPDNSVLIARVTHPNDDRTMPPDNRLEEIQIEDLKQWIREGAVWPSLELPADADQTYEEGVVPNEYLLGSHWAWQPLATPEVPEIPMDSPLAFWHKSPIDKFVLSRQLKLGLAPTKDASRATLLRRLSYDLTGLPPTEDELLAFLLDESPSALETVVDRLLESPAFGERWGRQWLDVARYGESTGSARNLPYPHAWRYRDYVIDSFNADKPFDKFIREQVAGDLLPANSPAEKREQLIATGFLALGVKDVNQRFKVRYDMDNVDEQIDAVSRAFLGLTVSCARCHDHKFDPISTRDYYALAGLFTSTETCDALRNQMGGGGLAYYVPERLIKLFDAPTELDSQLQLELSAKQEAAKQARARFISVRDSVKQKDRGPEHAKILQKARQKMLEAQAELVALTDPALVGAVAMGVREAMEIGDTQVRIRGEAEKLGPPVARGFLTLLQHVPKPVINQEQSGRLELARWLTHGSNSLTQRVIVNRIWQHLFGDGLVRTVDNFGATGDEPTHPELLDYLAGEFSKQGWSIKKLVRSLVLTRTYQLSSEATEAIERDPANRWLWRHSPRRLDAEEIRDSILFASRKLEPQRPEKTPSHQLPVSELRNNGPEAKTILDFASQSNSRSIYLPLLRTLVPPSLATFDFVEQGMVTGKRETTTVAPQALYMLNSGLVREHSILVSQRAKSLAQKSPDQLVSFAYRQILQRQPSPTETQRALAFISDYKESVEAHRSTVQSAPESPTQKDADAESTNPSAAGLTEQNRLGAAAAPEDSRDTAITIDEFVPSGQPVSPDDAALAAFCQALFSSAEFRYVR